MWFFNKTPAAPSKKPVVKSAGSSADIRAQAMENARAAREMIGEETLQRLAEVIQKKQAHDAKLAQARQQISQKDKALLADEIKWMMGKQT